MPTAALLAFMFAFQHGKSIYFQMQVSLFYKMFLLLLLYSQPESLAAVKVAVKSILRTYSLRTRSACQELQKKAFELKLNLCINKSSLY